MNLKKSIFGFGAATLLSLSMASGAVAEDVDGSVELIEGVCSIAVTSGAANFGGWTWDGDEYVGGNTTAIVETELKAGSPAGTCDVTVTVDEGLVGQNTGVVIEPHNFNGTYMGVSKFPIPDNGSQPFPNKTAGNYDLNLELIMAGLQNLEPDTFEGTILVMAANNTP